MTPAPGIKCAKIVAEATRGGHPQHVGSSEWVRTATTSISFAFSFLGNPCAQWLNRCPVRCEIPLDPSSAGKNSLRPWCALAWSRIVWCCAYWLIGQWHGVRIVGNRGRGQLRLLCPQCAPSSIRASPMPESASHKCTFNQYVNLAHRAI